MSGHRNPKSLRSRVTALVRELGEATTDDILPQLPGFTHSQVQTALQNEKFHGFLVIVRRAPKPGRGGGAPAVYAASTRVPKEDRKPQGCTQHRRITAYMGQIPSVWALGSANDSRRRAA